MPPLNHWLLLLMLTAVATAQQLEPDASALWKVCTALTPAPSTPAVMLAHGARVFLLHDAALDEYLPASDAWKPGVVRLPQPLGSGAAACFTPAGLMYVLRGGGMKDCWAVDPVKGTVDILPALPRKAGRGAALAFDHDHQRLHALRGDVSLDIYEFDPAQRVWTALERVGGGTTLAGIGQSTGAIQYSNNALYVWPDHHIQRYDLATKTWLSHVHMSYGQRPWWDGAAWGQEPGTSRWFVVQGGASRTLSVFDPEARLFALLRPRLPVMFSGEGSRAVVTDIAGTRTLLVYALGAHNHLFAIPLNSLERITPASAQSDMGSPWRTLHENAGGSLVRRNAPKPVLGLMGPCGPAWYFGRLKNMRLMDPVSNTWSGYPGSDTGRPYALGLCAAGTPDAKIYILTGGAPHFVVMDAATQKIAKLADCPMTAGPGAAAIWWRGRVRVLAGGGQRNTFAFDPESGRWNATAALPAEVKAPGECGAALAVVNDKLHAVCGDCVLRLNELDVWEPVATLPFELSLDGGMAAGEGTGPRLVCAAGGGSRRLCTLGDAIGIREELLPDAVSVAGQRALVWSVDGKPHFCIHRGHDSHEIWLRPLDELLPSGRN